MTMWVFGYGSLLWNPGINVAEKVLASLSGYARSFCMRSIHHRGSDEKPGLVLALDQTLNAYCNGVVLRVMTGDEDNALSYLRERELISSAYVEKMLDVTLLDGTVVTALTYVVDPEHVQYCGGLPLEEQAQIIAKAWGGRGANSEYLYKTASQLHKMGVADKELDWLVSRVAALSS
jgi:cation transport protein ChaC